MIMKEHTHFREDGTEYTHVHHNADRVAESHVHHHDHGGTGHVHRHVHSAEEKKKVMNRLSRAIGHLEAVKRMVERDEDSHLTPAVKNCYLLSTERCCAFYIIIQCTELITYL